MKPNLRLGLPIMAIGAALIVAGVLLVVSPWGGDTPVEEAAAGTIRYRLCDVVLEAPPGVAPQPGQERLVVGRMVSVEGDPASQFDPYATLTLEPELRLEIRGAVDSAVTIDPTTGAVSMEQYGKASQRSLLEGILDTLRIEPFDAAAAPWPYTDASQAPPKRVKYDIFEYRLPDPASGLVASQMLTDTLHGPVHSFILANCRSVEMISFDPFTGEESSRIREVHPEDEAAFEAFLEELRVEVLES